MQINLTGQLLKDNTGLKNSICLTKVRHLILTLNNTDEIKKVANIVKQYNGSTRDAPRRYSFSIWKDDGIKVKINILQPTAPTQSIYGLLAKVTDTSLLTKPPEWIGKSVTLTVKTKKYVITQTQDTSTTIKRGVMFYLINIKSANSK